MTLPTRLGSAVDHASLPRQWRPGSLNGSALSPVRRIALDRDGHRRRGLWQPTSRIGRQGGGHVIRASSRRFGQQRRGRQRGRRAALIAGMAGAQRPVPAGDGRDSPLPRLPWRRWDARRAVRAERRRRAGARARHGRTPTAPPAGGKCAEPAVHAGHVACAGARVDHRALRYPRDPRLPARANHTRRGVDWHDRARGVSGVRRGRGAGRHRHPDRGAHRTVPPQPDPVSAALHRRDRAFAADHPVQDRRRTAAAGQPGARRCALRDRLPGPRPQRRDPAVRLL